MKKIAFLALLPLLAGCVDDMDSNDGMMMESDISQANINTVCPADVSEADRANYPACN